MQKLNSTLRRLPIQARMLNSGSFRALSTTGQPKKNQIESKPIMDEKERENFSQWKNMWWDMSSSLAPLHSMNRVRVPCIRDALLGSKEPARHDIPLKGYKILDIGCGGGILSEALARIGAEVVGIDPSSEGIEAARDHSVITKEELKRSGIDMKLTYHAKDLGYFLKENPGQSFDLVALSEVIEHIDDWPNVLKQAGKAVKQDGFIFISTINRTMIANIVAIHLAETLGYIPKGAHTYEKLVQPSEVKNVLKEMNFATRQIIGTQYNPFMKRMEYSSTAAINYMLVGQKI